jgi:hypothetical protein
MGAAIDIATRVRPSELRLFARVPAICAASGARYFGLIELCGGTVTMLDRCSLDGAKAPYCLPLPGMVRRFATAPSFVCPGCRRGGGGLFVPDSERDSDLLHSCIGPYRSDACGCGHYGGRRFVDCLGGQVEFRVRGELIAPHSFRRSVALSLPGVPDRLLIGGSRDNGQ